MAKRVNLYKFMIAWNTNQLHYIYIIRYIVASISQKKH